MLRLRTFGVKGVEIPYSGAVVGDILCSDLTIVSAANYSASGKTAIGVVIYNALGVLKAVSLAEVSRYFSSYDSNIPGLTDFAEMNSALTDIDGRANTSIIFTALGSYAYAAVYCRSFTTTGTQVGDWDLPALGELKYIIDNLSAIQSSLSSVSGTSIVTYGYWASSTESDAAYQWVAMLHNGTYHRYLKQRQMTVRPITKITY